MISLHEISEFSKKSLHDPQENEGSMTEDIYSKLLPLHEKIISSLIKDTSASEDKSVIHNIFNDGLLFVAIPEFLFSKISEIVNVSNYKKGKDDELEKLNQALGFNIKKEHINYLNSSLNSESKCACNIDHSQVIKGILMCHGLSPVKDDSILLLADIGRLSRAAIVLNLPIKAMLADTSWMSYNLSSYQITGLNDEDKENNLNACLSKRKNLYLNLGIDCEIKCIRQQPIENLKYGDVNKNHIDEISNQYVSLAKCLFGEEVIEVAKDPKRNKVINQTLITIKPPLKQPEFIEIFSRFPNIVISLEESLQPHLRLIKEVVQNFNSLDSGRFTYFITQYFAQRDYKGEYLKIAPESEAKFDLPFEHLTECFEKWIAEKKFINTTVSEINPTNTNSRLASIYLPHYYFGKNYTLPYTPASGDIIINFKEIDLIEKNVILLNDKKTLEEIAIILYRTPIYCRNRLLADLMSFIMYSILKTNETPEKVIAENINEPDFGTFDEILEGIDPFIKRIFHTEIKIYKEDGVSRAWNTWLKVIDKKNNPYIPLHICFLLLDDDDWKNETKKLNLSKVIRVAIKLAHKLR